MVRLKKYIGDKAFYRMTFTVAMPIMLQNFITNLVNLLDNLMVGAIGTEQMSGVAIINQLIFVFNLTVFGAMSGAGIFTAQYFGKKDENGIRYTFRCKFVVALLISAVTALVFLLWGDKLIGLYLHDGSATGDLEATFRFAKEYLAVIIIGLVPFALTQAFAGTLRETGETFMPMVIGFAAVCTNCLFNFLLIFGKLGFPRLGVKGAAIATVISRFVECAAVIVYIYVKKERFTYIKRALSSLYIPAGLLRSITFRGMPLLFNELFWSAGMSLMSVSYSLHGIDVVAGVSMSGTITNLFNIAFLSFGTSIGIIVGKQLGANDFDDAVDTVRKMTAFSIFVSVFIGAAMFLASGPLLSFYNTSEASKAYASYFIRCSACFFPLIAFMHAAYFTIRSGGRTYITILFDSVYMMLISVPTAFALFYVFHLPIRVIFPLVQAVDVFKCLAGYILLKKRIWLNNIVQ